MNKAPKKIKNVIYYNMIFPVWILMLFPLTWLIVLPGNFAVDSLVLLLGMYLLKIVEKKKYYKQSIVYVFIFGLLSDFIGSGFLFLTLLLGKEGTAFYEYVTEPIARNPFDNVYALLYTFLSVLISGCFIYLFNRFISFKKIEDKRHKRLFSLLLAVLTAPYFFLIPTETFFGGQTENFTNHFVWENYIYAELYLDEDEANDILKVESGDAFNHEVVNVLRDCINTANKTKNKSFDEWEYKVVFYRIGLNENKLDEILIFEENGELYFNFNSKTYVIEKEHKDVLLDGIDNVLNPPDTDEEEI